MKLFHLSDLHIGKKLQGESLLEDQAYILNIVIEQIEIEKPDAVMIAGDVYDKSVPAADAVMLLDKFLNQLSLFQIPILIISGNHDSPERLQFGSRMFEKKQIYIGAMFQGEMEKVTLKDEYGEIHVYLLPFIKPAMVQPYFEEQIESYENAVIKILEKQPVTASARNLLIAHQFVVNNGKEPDRSDSERMSLGGVDSMEASIFKDFDYVALGHVHRPQKVGKMHIRYAGSPLKYSFSEINHKKAITVVILKEKGVVELKKVPLHPLKEMVELRGTLQELLSEDYKEYRAGYYLSITVTDEEKLIDPIGQLRTKFEGILEFQIERTRNKTYQDKSLNSEDLDKKTPFALFEDFYKNQNEEELTDVQKKILEDVLLEMGER
jgi:exonuclease SbcD